MILDIIIVRLSCEPGWRRVILIKQDKFRLSRHAYYSDYASILVYDGDMHIFIAHRVT